MANLPEIARWEDGVYQIEMTDPVVGGLDGISNIQGRQLANRTAFLKGTADEVAAARGGKATLAERLAQYDAFSPDQQSALAAGVFSALHMAGANARDIDAIRRRVLAQGRVLIKNKFVLSGYALTKSDIRALHLSATGTVGSGVSRARLDGLTVSLPDDDYALSVPTNDTPVARTYYAVLRRQSVGHGLEIADGEVPDDALALYRLDVPAGHTANNLTGVALVDLRLIQPDNGWLSNFVPYAVVALKEALPAADYGVELEVEGTMGRAAVGLITAYDKAPNGFKIAATGSADNISIRWTIINPSYQ
ncbi:hypothetical protein [Niveispirillum sp. SYP-B3756]|uniref:hypothetical protein n=1 Tax=Niveispirillum sp. SYP-B3756 TaxID=2662178 RepID=UPI001B3BBF00|nr:hypothetical protein [Niveispirillum sp. SYP-B3756]